MCVYIWWEIIINIGVEGLQVYGFSTPELVGWWLFVLLSSAWLLLVLASVWPPVLALLSPPLLVLPDEDCSAAGAWELDMLPFVSG